MITERDKQAYECLGMIEALATMTNQPDEYIARRVREKWAELEQRNAAHEHRWASMADPFHRYPVKMEWCPDCNAMREEHLGPMSDVVTKITHPAPEPQISTTTKMPDSVIDLLGRGNNYVVPIAACPTCGSPEKAVRWCGIDRAPGEPPHHTPEKWGCCKTCTDPWHEGAGR